LYGRSGELHYLKYKNQYRQNNKYLSHFFASIAFPNKKIWLFFLKN